MPPILSFVLGVLCSELVQLGLWGMAHKGKGFMGYFSDGWAHFVLAWAVCGMACLLWAINGLDLVMDMLPSVLTSHWADTGVPFTPQVGAGLGFGVDFMADKIAFALRMRFAGENSMAAVPQEVVDKVQA